MQVCQTVQRLVREELRSSVDKAVLSNLHQLSKVPIYLNMHINRFNLVQYMSIFADYIIYLLNVRFFYFLKKNYITIHLPQNISIS